MATTFSTAVYVEASPSAVFDAMVDLDSWKHWVPNFVSVEKVTPGPVGVGAEWRETRKMFGKEATEHFRVTRWQPPSRIDIHIDGSRGTTGRGEYLFTYELLPERTGTNVELTGEIRMSGLAGLLAKMTVGRFKKACHADLEALKHHLERRASARAS